MAYLVIGLGVAVIVLFILCIVLFVKFSVQKKKYDYFMGANRRPSANLEMKIQDYYETSKRIEEKYSKLLDMVTDMDKTDKTKIQKVGLIRYNPFDEMGGNLCFALALLDGHDNGVVLNGIHSRTGSFTYAKPIEMGVSTYMLSEEEIKAVEMAKNHAYEPEHEKWSRFVSNLPSNAEIKTVPWKTRSHWIRWKWWKWMKQKKDILVHPLVT
jgi:hypothetical protein